MKHRYPREHHAFLWTPQRLTLLRREYEERNPLHTLSLAEVAESIADAQSWPVEAVKTQLACLSCVPVLPTPRASTRWPAALLATQPTAEAGHFLWEARIEEIGRRRWALRYPYGTFPWLEGRTFAHQGQVYRVRRAWCSLLELELVQMEVRP